MSVETWRKRPVDVQMIEWTGDNLDEIAAWTGDQFRLVTDPQKLAEGHTAEVYDDQHSEWIKLMVGHRVARGPKGEFYPISAIAHEWLYEAPPAA